MYLAPRWIDRNLSRAELVISVTLIAVLIGTFNHYSLVIYSRAERTMLNTTIVNINTALRYRVLLARLKEGAGLRTDFARFNPMTDMQMEPLFPGPDAASELGVAGAVYAVIDTPANYVGELESTPSEPMEKGVWYYDRELRELVYTVINTEYFETELPGQARVRFRLEVAYEDTNRDGRLDPATDIPRSVVLKSPEIFSWKT